MSGCEVFMPDYCFDYTDVYHTCFYITDEMKKALNWDGYCCHYYEINDNNAPDGKQPCGDKCYKVPYMCDHMIESVRESKGSTYCWYAKGDHGSIGLPCGDECYLIKSGKFMIK